MGRFTIQLFDILGEGMQTSFKTESIANDGSNFSSVKSKATAFQDALIDITDGEVGLSALAQESKSAIYPPVNIDGNSVLRDQWVCKYTDNVTNRVFTARIPTAEEPNATPMPLPDGSKVLGLDLSSGKGLAFKTAWDALVRSEDGNPTTLNMVFLRK